MKAPCPVYRKCSGCTLMQFPYVKQLHDKGKLVHQRLAPFLPREGGAPSDVISPVVPSPAELGYRTSTKLCLSEDEFGRRSVGLYERGTKKVVAIPDCPVHHPAINQLAKQLLTGRLKPPAPFYNHAKRGFQAERLKFLTVRFCPETGAFGLVLSHTGVAGEALARWAAEFAQPNISIYGSELAKSDGDLIISHRSTHLAGPPSVPFAVGGRSFLLSPLAFFQANHALIPRFVDHVTAGLGGDVLLDLYGGFGAYGLAAAPRFKRVHLVDANPHAIDAAKRAAAAGGLKGVTVACDSVEAFFARRLAPKERQTVTHVVANPPRGGLSPKVLATLTGPMLPAVTGMTYVSCNVETLRRDLAKLSGIGRFRVESVTPFDMFPQTDHLELIVKLTRRQTTGRGTNLGASPRRSGRAPRRPS